MRWAFLTACSQARKISRASIKNAFPAAVRATPFRSRWNRLTPSSPSRSWICLLNGGCDTCSRSAAWVKFNSSAAATKYSRCRSFISGSGLSARVWATASSALVEPTEQQKDTFKYHTFAITESNGERFKKSIGKLPEPDLALSDKFLFAQ